MSCFNPEHNTPNGPPQTFSFLSLPAEIRNSIYRLALISESKIDLWPDAFVPEHSKMLPRTFAGKHYDHACLEDLPDEYKIRDEIEKGLMMSVYFDGETDDDEEPDAPYNPFNVRYGDPLTPFVVRHGWTRLRKSVPKHFAHLRAIDDETVCFPATVFDIQRHLIRDQHDLRKLRKELATGLLTTCKLVRAEASPLFWGENNFRFSGDGGWDGLLRFFITIGPVARRYITHMDISVPLEGIEWLGNYFLYNDTTYLDVRSKNNPKLRMTKIPSAGSGSLSTVHQVAKIIREDGFLKRLTLLIPQRCRMRNNNRCWQSLVQIQRILQSCCLTQVNLAMNGRVTLGMADPDLVDPDMTEPDVVNIHDMVNILGWNFVMYLNRFHRLAGGAFIITYDKYDYLAGVARLFGRGGGGDRL
ncbi:MAG: hypothetical protein Q9216_003557 [Gyalolechia sp. 2 TL-2023]